MSKLMKIAVVVPKFGLVGGGERFVYELTVRLAQNNRNDVHVFANRWKAGSERITFHRVPIISFPKWLTTISFAWFAKRMISKNGYDLIHAHERVLRADVCSLHFVPHQTWIREIRNKKFGSLFDMVTSWIEKRMFSNAGGCKFVMPVSSLARDKFLDCYPMSGNRVRIIPPAVDVSCFNPTDKKSGKNVRVEFGISENDFLFLFVGMNFELKGLNFVLAAMNMISSKRHEKSLKLLVVGKGNVKKYTDIADSLGLAKQVFFAGVRQDMAEIYQAADALVLFSDFDTFGMVVTEAMAFGLPVIVSDRVGAQDMVREGENGFVVKKRDVDRLAENMEFLQGNPDKCAAMGRVARASVRDSSWDSVALEVSKIYSEVLS